MKAIRTAGFVLIGVFAAWDGYWIGHALGWSRNAEWPWSIGGGGGAIALSIGMSVVAVLAAAGFVTIRPILRNRQLIRTGTHAQGMVLGVRDTGFTVHRHGALLHQSQMDLEVHPEGSTPYVAHTRDYLDDREVAYLLPGSTVSLRFDPNHPKRVAIEHEMNFN